MRRLYLLKKFHPIHLQQKNQSLEFPMLFTLCVHPEFKVQDNPNNSKCVDGWRYIPIELIDLPGLIKDAWKGKGLRKPISFNCCTI